MFKRRRGAGGHRDEAQALVPLKYNCGAVVNTKTGPVKIGHSRTLYVCRRCYDTTDRVVSRCFAKTKKSELWRAGGFQHANVCVLGLDGSAECPACSKTFHGPTALKQLGGHRSGTCGNGARPRKRLASENDITAFFTAMLAPSIEVEGENGLHQSETVPRPRLASENDVTAFFTGSEVERENEIHQSEMV